MKVDRDTRAAHGAALLAAAMRLFRSRGLDPVRIADVSEAAGLTHGAFYGHFASKSALAEAACRRGLQDGAARWRLRAERARAAGCDPIAAIIDGYLTEQHRDAPGEGCVIGSLAQEIGRAEPGLRGALADGADLLEQVLAEEIALRHPDRPPTPAAAATFAAMLGGLMLARAHAADPERSRTALAAAAAIARQAADLPPPSRKRTEPCCQRY